jgi:threonylcarbamoyladenosine tRNA methylthiotransferase MtaB
MRTVAFHTLGCKLNYSETSTLARQLHEVGYAAKPFDSNADVYVINTCSVTENADKECREIVRKTLRNNPEGIIVITGCYAQLKPKEISEIPGVDLVLGASEKFNLASYLEPLTQKNETGVFHSCDIESIDTFAGAYSIGDRTRSFLKIQDGCDYSCTYCTIPMARGKSRSSTLSQVLDQALEISQQGVKEIVLTGVNTGDFHQTIDGKSVRFIDVLQQLDTADNAINRYRISSIEPNLLTNEIIDLVSKSKRIMPHFHVPLQSGSDAILKLMKRRYLSALYEQRVSEIKSKIPHACIGVDVIVGFPGETDKHFQQTYDFINRLDVSYLHVFTYSERPNTVAASMGASVPMAVRKQRNRILRALSDAKRAMFYNLHLGSQREVLWEQQHSNDVMFGFTDNYIKVQATLTPTLTNQLQLANLTKLNVNGNVDAEICVLV